MACQFNLIAPSHVAANSKCRFLLAKLTIDQLLEFPTIKKMRKALTDLPKQLNDAFDTSVARIDAQPKALREVAHRLIGWIVSAERPLRTAEVTHAFAVDPGDEEVDEENMVMLATLLRACAGLVAVDKDRDNFGMVHKLAHEFFQRRYAEATSIHEDMARTSIAYLSLKTLRSGPCCTIYAMDDRLSCLPFLQYAARHWGKHAMMPGVESSVREPTRALLDDPGLRSSAFEVLNYRDDMANRDIAAAIFDSLPKGQSQLHIAAHWGFELITKDILEAGGDYNAADYQGWTPLHWATSRGHVNTMRILIESGADVNIQDAQGWTPLIWSSFNGSVPATELLLKKGARYLEIDVHGWTALHWAVSRQKPDIVRLLLKHHREYKDCPKSGRVRAATTLPSDSDHFNDSRPPSAIELAAVRADVEIFDLLLKAGDCQDNDFNHWIDAGGFDPPMSNMWRTMNKAERHHGMDYYIARSVEYSTPDNASDTWRAALLHSAIKDDKFEIVQLLLSMGTGVNAQTHARSALHAAACKEDPRFAKILLENHADVSELDLHDQTALHQAILNGFYETADALIRGGSDVNARMSKKAQYSLRRALPVKGMGIDLKRGAISLTPLMLVTGLKSYGDEDESRTTQANISKLLLSNGADVSLTDEGGRTCLHMAAYAGNEDLALRLLAAGAEVSRRDGRKATPLHYASQFGHVAMTRTLLEAGADPSARDSFGFAVIHGAALSCNIEVVRLLIEKGVDIYAVDNLGRNALHYFATGSKCTETGSEDLRHIFRWLYPERDLGRLNAAAQYDRDRSEFASFSGSYQISLSRKHTPLSMTLSDSNWEVFHLLRETDAEISEPSEDFFRQAVHSIQPKALQYLLEKGVTSEIKESFKKSIPDFYVSKDIDPDELDAILPALISLGFDINTVSYGRSKLGTAATTTNSAYLARVLLRHGANPYTGHPDLDSFLLAATCQNWDFLHALVLHSPRPAPEGHWTQHLDNTAVSQHDELERLCIALQRSSFTADKGHIIFSEAVRNRNEKLARLLIAHGLDVNKRDEFGWPPLHYAVLYQIVPAVTDLLHAGANVDTASVCWFNSSWTGPRPSALDSNNPWTGTALHLATLVANEEIVSMLLDRGADLDAGTGCNSKGYWPLHGPRALHIALGTGTSYGIDAACLGHARLNIARMLVERGACVKTVADHLRMHDLKWFQGYEDVWEAVRVGITDE
jgi:ankyrin repeat protein